MTKKLPSQRRSNKICTNLTDDEQIALWRRMREANYTSMGGYIRKLILEDVERKD